MYKLYPRQEEVFSEGLRILEQHRMLYLALSPRYGKSPISLSILEEQNPKQSVLFVTTKSAIDGIHNVIESFDIRLEDIKIMNYEQLHNLPTKAKYDTIVIDEAHKLATYPKPNNRYKYLKKHLKPSTQLIWLSGTTNIESSSQLFHQLALSPSHTFSKFTNFYKWHKVFGIQGLSIYTGGPRPSIDYSQTRNFNEHFDNIMIRRILDDVLLPKFIPVHVKLPAKLRKLYSDIQTKSIAMNKENVFIANNGASKLSKMQQICAGSCIDDEGEAIQLSDYKVKEVFKNHRIGEVCIFYKYQADKELLSTVFPVKDLYQADSMVTGLDLSHYKEMAIYSMTFSGANFAQLTERLVNSNRTTQPLIYVYLTQNSIDESTYETVMDKRDSNNSFLRGE